MFDFVVLSFQPIKHVPISLHYLFQFFESLTSLLMPLHIKIVNYIPSQDKVGR